MASFEAAYGGNGGGSYRLHIDIDLLYQEVENNRSRCRVVAYMKEIANYQAWNLNPSPWSVSTNGGGASGSLTYDGRGAAAGPWFLVNPFDVWIGHDGAGNASFSVSASHDAQNSPYLTSAGVSGAIGLPTINRYASYYQIDFVNINDIGFDVNIGVTPTCNELYYALDGGGWVLAYSGSFTTRTLNIRGLTSGRAHTIRFSVRRQDSGLYTETGWYTVSTDVQNKFFDAFEF